MRASSMKQCSKCGVVKPLSLFNKCKASKNGYQSYCNDCKSAFNKSYYQQHKLNYDIRDAKRRASKMQRTPRWIKDVFVDEIKVIYRRAKLIKKFTGETWHVDHIVPLKGKKVSGLHVPWNLQLLPASENLAKSNKFTP
jgi:5-methylcytosine-specific restriction endonuclease McrA